MTGVKGIVAYVVIIFTSAYGILTLKKNFHVKGKQETKKINCSCHYKSRNNYKSFATKDILPMFNIPTKREQYNLLHDRTLEVFLRPLSR